VAKSFHALDGYYRRARAVASLALHVTSMNARRSWQRVTGSDFLRGHRPNEWTNELKQVCEKQNCAPRGIGGPTRACNGFDWQWPPARTATINTWDLAGRNDIAAKVVSYTVRLDENKVRVP
jgi:hypothetical protein